MFQRRSIWFLFILPFIGTAALAQASDELEIRAAEAYQSEQWPVAAEAYGELVNADESNGRGWYRLGVSLRHTGQYTDAIDALSKAEAAGVPPGFTQVEIAKAQVAAGHHDMAITALEAAIAGGFSNFQALESDEDLATLASNPGFVQLVDNARRNSMPCEYNEHFNDFNFWVGDWEVSDKAGTQPYGSNRIEKIEKNCLMVEHWLSATGGTGLSVNYYDPSTGQWTQKWVSGGGSIIDISGGLDNGSMILTGTMYTVSNDEKKPFRGTWTPLDDGRVRQFFEQSNDEGKTWGPWFDGYYSRKTGE